MKKFFIISFIPYIVILVLIFTGSYNVNGVDLKGLELYSKLAKTYAEICLIHIPIIPACLTFQLCYMFKNKPKTMFLMSYFPYLCMILVAIYYSIVGFSFIPGATPAYGLEGFKTGLFTSFLYYFLVFPLIPACIIFRIIYIVKKRKEEKKLENKLEENIS